MLNYLECIHIYYILFFEKLEQRKWWLNGDAAIDIQDKSSNASIIIIMFVHIRIEICEVHLIASMEAMNSVNRKYIRRTIFGSNAVELDDFVLKWSYLRTSKFVYQQQNHKFHLFNRFSWNSHLNLKPIEFWIVF